LYKILTGVAHAGTLHNMGEAPCFSDICYASVQVKLMSSYVKAALQTGSSLGPTLEMQEDSARF